MAQTPITPAFIASEPRNAITDLSRSVFAIDPTPGNALKQYHEGLFVPAAAAGAETPLTVTDSTTVNLTAGTAGNGHTGVTAVVIIDPKVGNLITATPSGLLAELTCASVKERLLDQVCIPLVSPITAAPTEVNAIASVYGVKADGTIVREKRRPLVRINGEGNSTVPVITKTDTVANLAAPAGRMIHSWVAGIGFSQPNQNVDILTAGLPTGYDRYIIKHSGWYMFNAAVYVRLKMDAATAVTGKSFSLISAVVIKSPATAIELRFGEDTVEVNASNTSALVGSGYDVVHAGAIGPIWMEANWEIWCRSWVAGGNAASNSSTVSLSILTATGVTFGIHELPDTMF